MNPSAAERPYTGQRASQDDDAVLVRRMAAGDEAALGAFHDRWAAAALGLALQMLREREEAAEVVEDAFWQAWRQAGRYEAARASAGSWLLVMVRSRALDRLRARRRRHEEPLPEAEALDGLAVADEAPDAAEVDERRRIVRTALAALPAEQRQVVELAYFGGFTQQEIATRTGQPLGTVKTRARLALLKLQDGLRALRDGGG